MSAPKTFLREIDGIYRLKVPFEDLYTSVFLIKAENGYALVDCAACENDADGYILPALHALGLTPKDIKYLILTHSHGDHAGGKERLLSYYPRLETVESVCPISLNGLTVYALKGHTLDCIGVLDERTGTLIAGDGLQGAGVGKYRCSLESEDEYIQTINKIEKDERIKNLLFSHAYEPWCKDGAFGREEVEKCLKDCKKCIKKEK